MRTCLIAAVFLVAALPARADRDSFPPVADPVVAKECGACHLAFQPGLLPARSWRGIMAGLADHFGEDASLEPATAAQIERYMVDHAADAGWFGRLLRTADGPAPLRITETGWFRHEHGEEEARWMAARRDVKTLADCGACHRGAAHGVYDDD